MIPILYSANETIFETNGLGMLSDAVSCSVTEELNGQFELNMRYPLDGIHSESLDYRNIILAKTNPVSDPQPFRIYRLVPSSAGYITVYARHIAYDLQSIPVKPYGSSASAASALNALKNNTAVYCPFVFRTDKSTAGNFSVSTPKPLWRCLGGTEGSILDVYGGEYEFDRYTVNLWNHRGTDRGVSIRYGKNLKTLEQDKNCAECYTGVYPYWADSDGNLVELPEKIIYADGTYGYVSILTLDLSQEWQDAPTVSQLRSRARNYMASNDIGVPTVSWTIEFVRLEQTAEYKNLKVLEQVLLGDGITVVFPKMHIDAVARVVAIEYDPIAERYITVTLGRVKSNMASTIAQQQLEIDRKPSASLMQSIIMTLTSRILGAKGGAVRLLDTDGDGMPDTLYVADNADPELAKKVWRWNYEGWAGSLNGYNGPFTVGATLEDGLLATAVTAASLVAGTIQSADDGKTFFLDLDKGVLKMDATELTIGGKSVDTIAEGKASAAVNAQTQQDIFNRLTNNGTIKGIYMKNGQLYINATYLATGILSSVDGKTFYLDLDKGILNMAATSLTISGKSVSDVASDEAEAAADAALSDAKTYADAVAKAAVKAQTQQDIFNVLTNNGQDQGIYLQDGKIYINSEYLMAGQIKSDKITLNGLFEIWGISTLGNLYRGGYMGYMTGNVEGIPTDGVAIYNRDKSCYVIVTTAGVRLQAGNNSLYLTPDMSGVAVSGDLRVSGNIKYGGTIGQA